MPLQDDLTTLVCLFHHQKTAEAVIHDLVEAGLSRSSITTVGGEADEVDYIDKSELASLGMPDKDYDHLKRGVRAGGVVVSVSQVVDTGTVERIFGKHSAEKIDEADTAYRPITPAAYAVPEAAPAVSVPAAPTAIVEELEVVPVIERDLTTGRTVIAPGVVRVYRPFDDLRDDPTELDETPSDL